MLLLVWPVHLCMARWSLLVHLIILLMLSILLVSLSLIFVHLQQVEFKRIVSPLKYQTRCLAAFPDQQGFLVCIIPHFFYIFYAFLYKSYFLLSFYLWKWYPILPNRALLFIESVKEHFLYNQFLLELTNLFAFFKREM